MSRLGRLWAEYVAAYRYVADPHGWWLGYDQQVATRHAPRPGMLVSGNTIYVHPAIEQQVRRLVQTPTRELGGFVWFDRLAPLGGTHIIVSPTIVQQAPPGGWPDVHVPERPR